MLTRRAIITRVALAAPAVAALSRPSFAEDKIRIRVSTAAPPSDFLSKCLEQFKQDVDNANIGLAVEVYNASALFKQGTEVQALQRGNLEMSTMTTFEVAQQFPEYGFFNRAYLFRDYTHLHTVFYGSIGADYRQVVSEKMGIEILATLYLGTRQVNLRNKRDVKGPADLAGIKLRMPSGPEWLLLGRTLGVNPVPMGMPEVYLAMKTGTIDGQENPLAVLNAAKLYEVSEQIVLTAHMLQPVFINIATPFWNKLNPAQKAVLEKAAIRAAKTNDDSRLADEASALDGLKARGLVIQTPDLSQFRTRADTVYADYSGAKVWNKDWLRRVIDTP
jgi:tripartite ATP-independent transporter DctP family solute receptor